MEILTYIFQFSKSKFGRIVFLSYLTLCIKDNGFERYGLRVYVKLPKRKKKKLKKIDY